MGVIARQLRTGHSIIFDQATRSLFVVNPKVPCKDLASAERLVEAGQAKKFDKSKLAAVNAALASIVLLIPE
jgi:hypothetical protein